MSSTENPTKAPSPAEKDTSQAGHHHHHGKTDARTPPPVDCTAMHKEDALAAQEKLKHDDVHHFDGQPDEQRLRAGNILKDPNSPADAKLNALDGSEALPHGGYLRGDLTCSARSKTTANYTGGGLVGRRKAKRRVRQDITGTPAYTAAARQAYQARPGPLLADISAAHHLGGRRKGQPLASPTFDFAFLRNMQHESPVWARPAASETRRAGGDASWTTTTAAPGPFSRGLGDSEFLRRQLLADPDWVGLHSVPRPQPSFLRSSRPAAPPAPRLRPRSPTPDARHWSRPAEVAPTILRGSSVLHGGDDVSSAGLAYLPRSTPPSFVLSQTSSLDAASAAVHVPTESFVESRAPRPLDSPPPRPQQTPLYFRHDDAGYSFFGQETAQQQQQPQHGQDDEHEVLSFTSSTRDPAFGPQLSAHAYAVKYAAPDDDEHLGTAAPRPTSPSPTLADSSAPSPAPAPDSPQPYHHLSHLHDPLTPHLADSLDFAHLDDDGASVLFVHERMGLGCTGLSRAQADELVGRELALREVGPEAVPEWAWGDGEASEDGRWEDDGASEEGDPPTGPPRALDPPAAAASVAAWASAPSSSAASTSLACPTRAADVLNSLHPNSASGPALGGWRRWRRTADDTAAGTLFALDDLRGVMEP